MFGGHPAEDCVDPQETGPDRDPCWEVTLSGCRCHRRWRTKECRCADEGRPSVEGRSSRLLSSPRSSRGGEAVDGGWPRRGCSPRQPTDRRGAECVVSLLPVGCDAIPLDWQEVTCMGPHRSDTSPGRRSRRGKRPRVALRRSPEEVLICSVVSTWVLQGSGGRTTDPDTGDFFRVGHLFGTGCSS